MFILQRFQLNKVRIIQIFGSRYTYNHFLLTEKSQTLQFLLAV